MRENLRLIAAGLSLLVVVGCGEGTTAPATATRSIAASSKAPAFDYNSYSGSFGDQSTTFTLNASGGSFAVGFFNVNFPANSVCDPALSSYGEGTWNDSCVPLNRPLTVTARMRLSLSGVGIDFTPDIRFVPTQQVTLSTDMFAPFIRANRDYFAAHPSSLRPFALYYTSTLGGAPIADYITDASLVTHINLSTGRIWRRVKHFSGYSATTGDACDPSPGDPDCISIDGF